MRGKFGAHCCVPQCKSDKTKDDSLSFHRFPKGGKHRVTLDGKSELMDVREAWIKHFQIKRPVSRYMTVCSQHFKKEDYMPRALTSEIKRNNLKKSAVPSLNLPVVKKNSDYISLKDKYCSVPQCKSRKKNDHSISFHVFPEAGKHRVTVDGKSELVDARAAWLQKIGIEKPASKSSIVCSQHFTKDDYFPRNATSEIKRKVLKKTAVPSLNLPVKDSVPSTLISNIKEEKEEEIENEYECDENKILKKMTIYLPMPDFQ